jgi:hypothetical protein
MANWWLNSLNLLKKGANCSLFLLSFWVNGQNLRYSNFNFITAYRTNTFYSSLNFGLNSNLNYSRNNSAGFLGGSESNTSISDKKGNILYFIDGKDLFYNNLSNFISLNLSNFSATQGNLFLPYPKNDSLLFLFRIKGDTHNDSSPSSPLSYSILNSYPINDEIYYKNNSIEYKEKELMKTDTMGEKMTAIKTCWGYWLVVHGKKSDKFYSYKIDSTGLDTLPYISNSGIGLGVRNDIGKIVSNLEGNLLAAYDDRTPFFVQNPNNRIYFYNFNKNIGEIEFIDSLTNRKIINKPNLELKLIYVNYGHFHFSVYGKYIFLLSPVYDIITKVEHVAILRIPVSSIGSNIIIEYIKKVDNVQQNLYPGLQLGIDGYIYFGGIKPGISNGYSSFLNRIIELNEDSLIVEYNVVDFDDYILVSNLGNFPVTDMLTNNISLKTALSDSIACANKPIQFYNRTLGYYQSSYWEFGDGTFSTERNPSTYLHPTRYVRSKPNSSL